MPSLAQLDQAVREFIAENPTDQVTVVVDASFGHRIDPSELPAFEEAETAGEVVSPPAGAIGRGDAFLLRIAEKTGATVLSNDSFQEFHGEHVWLFDKGRLIGGKPVPGVGWIFMDRTPVRGAKSREVTKEAKRKKRAEAEVPGSRAANDPKAAAGPKVAAEAKPKARSKAVDRAIARATEEVVEPKAGTKSRRRRATSPPAEPVNEPLAFITFIAAHPLGSDVIGTVLEYSSHGAFVEADGARCYIPLSAMGTPPPRRAREVVTKGDPVAFVVQAFDPPRRGIELALPGFARVAGEPTAETVEAEISAEPEPEEPVVEDARRRRARQTPGRKAPSATAPPEAAPAVVESPPGPSGRERIEPSPTEETPPVSAPSVRKSAARKAVARKVTAEKVTAEKAGGEAVPEKAPAKRATRKKAAAETVAPAEPMSADGSVGPEPPARRPPAKKLSATRAAAEKVSAQKAPARKAAAQKVPAQKVPAKKAAAEKVPAKKAAAQKVPAQKAPAKKAAAEKAPARKAAAEKAPARKAAAKKAVAAAPTVGKGAASTAVAAGDASGPRLRRRRTPAPDT